MSAMNSDLFWMPDVEEILRRRYRILKVVEEMGNVGRRRIAARLDIPLSQVSKDTEIMCAMDLMVSTQGGFSVSREGRARMRQFEQENPGRIGCMKLEDKLGVCYPGAKVKVCETLELVNLEARRQESCYLRVLNWKEQQEQYGLEKLSLKDAVAEFEGMVISESGRPLYRTVKQEMTKSVWIRSEEGVSELMIYAVCCYRKPEVLLLSMEDAAAVYELCMKEREHNAGSCD